MAQSIADLQAAIAQNAVSLALLEEKVNLLKVPEPIDLTNEVSALAAQNVKIIELTEKVTVITG